jgi:hypothetical protein
MFDQAVAASQAMHQSIGCQEAALIPALCGCVTCGSVQMITSPVLGTCEPCGLALTLVSAEAAILPPLPRLEAAVRHAA